MASYGGNYNLGNPFYVPQGGTGAAAPDPRWGLEDEFLQGQQALVGKIGKDPIDTMVQDRLKQMLGGDPNAQAAENTFLQLSDPTKTRNALFTRGADQATAAGAARWGTQQEQLAMRGLTPQSGAFQAAQRQNMMQRQQDVQRAGLAATLGSQQQSMDAAGQLSSAAANRQNQNTQWLAQMQAQQNKIADQRRQGQSAIDYATFQSQQARLPGKTIYTTGPSKPSTASQWLEDAFAGKTDPAGPPAPRPGSYKYNS